MSANNPKHESLDVGPSAGDGPMAHQDAETRRMLKQNKEDIRKSNKLIWVSIFIASFGFLLIIIAWITLASSAPPNGPALPSTAGSSLSSPGNTTNRSEIYMKITALTDDIHQLNKTIKNTGMVVKDFESTLQREKSALDQHYRETENKLESLQSQKDQMTKTLSSLSTKYQEIWNEEKCGKATKVTSKVLDLPCTENKPCYCYGDICLTEGSGCSNGHVYQSGKPVCNTIWNNKGGNVVCNALGFYGHESTEKKSISSRNYFKTNCYGYESKISDCSKSKSSGEDCNGGYAFVTCKTVPPP